MSLITIIIVLVGAGAALWAINRYIPNHWPFAAALVTLLVLTALGGCRGAAREDAAASADQPAPPIAEPSAPPATPAQEQPEVLSRGPVHEAFAEPVSLQFQAGLVAPNQPPPNIEELPPAERPQGQQFVWIPGYWSWDADRGGYIWVSACWRVAPPSMSWVPGYWSRVSDGWEWIAGFWAPAGVREIEYLPAPPMVDDVEAHGSPPSPDTIWVPPCMYWAQGQYVRRAGYWLAAQADWVWVPSHYVVTPRGYIFADGHWDYSLERRGVLFAPVYFPAAAYRRSGFSYSPSIVIDVSLLRGSLFAYPRYSHYYFGDYYDDAYVRVGIYPRFDSQRLHTWYDPIYEHDRWQHQRAEPRWEERERAEYTRRRADTALRPARTFREQESRLAKLPEPQRRASQVVQTLTVAVTRQTTPLKFERINTDARQKIVKQATAVRTFRDERNRWESTAAGAKTTQPPRERGGTVTPPPEPTKTIKPPKERGGRVTPPPEPTETVKPPRERGGRVTPPPEPTETVKPPRERGGTVTPPPEPTETVKPPKERAGRVTPPPEPTETVKPPKERGGRGTPPTEPTETVKPPRERGGTVTLPAEPREPASVPPREAKRPRPERVQIPVPPGAGGSGEPGISQKGAPARPDDEDKDKEGKDIRKNKDKDTRKDGDERRGN